MCGIAGIIQLTDKGVPQAELYTETAIRKAVATLNKRGPDGQGIFVHQNIALGHTRLAIIDTTDAAGQPFFDRSGRYAIVFNGEIFNFHSLRQELQNLGQSFDTQSDTEVLLYGYIHWGRDCLSRLNGFFALAIYDRQAKTLFIARDRFGVKPLLVYQDKYRLLFASEMKALMAMGIEQQIDPASLLLYLQLNYIPPPYSIFKGVEKMEPGTCRLIDTQSGQSTGWTYYVPPPPLPDNAAAPQSYEQAQRQLFDLLDSAVQLRLIADVPLGAFLSGGIDSSVIAALAARHTPHLATFSIGFHDEPFFDETRYAQAAAKHIGTAHTVFSIKSDDLLASFDEALSYIDEPFADSSALAVFVLSRRTASQVRVALSGDGADEIFGGYRKHRAEYRVLHAGIAERLVSALSPLWQSLPQSRAGKLGDRVRQLARFAAGMNLPSEERYWQWASLLSEQSATDLLTQIPPVEEYAVRRQQLLQYVRKYGGINGVLFNDLKIILTGDMLTKVDTMSMANSLEVRTPFLDYRIVNFAHSLPASYKINTQLQKRLLQDTFRSILPPELYNRPKKGFEVPLLKWMRNELKPLIKNDLLHEEAIRAQGIFNPNVIKLHLDRLYSNNPGDSAANIWALLVFQYWWTKHVK